MYLRFTQRTNQDGTATRYVALAHNHRVDGKVKPNVLLNLGRVDRLDVDGLLRLAIRKHFGDQADGLSNGAEAGLSAGAAPMEVIDACPIGASWLLDGLWAKLGIGKSIKKIADGRRFTTVVERVLFALVANRAIEPMSKLSAAEWAREDVVVPGLTGMDDDQAYRVMDLLVEADTAGQVQETVSFAVAHLLNLEVDLLFFDTTSTYFETDDEDAPTGDGTAGFRVRGKSKDHRDDLPQIMMWISLAMLRAVQALPAASQMVLNELTHTNARVFADRGHQGLGELTRPPLIRWQADPYRRAARPEERKRRGSLTKGSS